jgi:hypothetical protein
MQNNHISIIIWSHVESIYRKKSVLYRPIRKRCVFDPIGLSINAVGFDSAIRFPNLDRLVQVLYLEIVKQWKQAMSLMEIIVD